MPAKRAASTTTSTAKEPKATCTNHPGKDAVHTTTTSQHSPISLCTVCLRRAPHLADR